MFVPLLEMLGLSGKRRTDRPTEDVTELSTQVSFARARQISRQLASTGATGGQAHNAVADIAALLTGAEGTLGLGHPAPDVVQLDGTGVRAGTNRTGTATQVAIGLTGGQADQRTRLPRDRPRAHLHLPRSTRPSAPDWPISADPNWAPASWNGSCANSGARTDIGRSRWSIPGLRDLLTVLIARLLHHAAWRRSKRPPTG